MSEATQPVPTAQPHRNHGLFSDHYLDVTLPERPQWKELVEQARPVMEEISRGLLHTQRGHGVPAHCRCPLSLRNWLLSLYY